MFGDDGGVYVCMFVCLRICLYGVPASVLSREEGEGWIIVH